MPHKILVAFKTQLVESLVPSIDEFSPPSNFKKPEAIAEWKAAKAESLKVDCLDQPYTSTFAEVQIADLTNKRRDVFKFRPADSGRRPVSLEVRLWLLKKFADAWPNSTHPNYKDGVPNAIFIGFSPKTFLKIMGIECSLPIYNAETSVALPLAMWYGNTDHRDIEEAVKPVDYKNLTWGSVLKARGLDEKYKGWAGPGVDVTKDLLLVTELASQLGMINDA